MHPFLGSQKKEKEKEKNKDSRRHKLVHQTPTSLISSQSSKSFSVISCSEKKRRGEKIGTPKYRLVGLSLSVDGRTFTARR
jgi:hypothetical protein